MIENIMITDFEINNSIWFILLPLILEVLDVITGYLNAWIKDDVQSKKMREGLGKKVGELVYCAVALLINILFNIPSISYFITGYICFMEIMSLAENCDKLGVPMPNVLKKKVNNLEEELLGDKEK
jgi:toxin secretion/phage lysis holin